MYVPTLLLDIFFLSNDPKLIGVNKNGPWSSFTLSIFWGWRCGCIFFKINDLVFGIFVKLAGGITVPESKTY